MDEFRLSHIQFEVPQDRNKRLAGLEMQVWSQRETFEIEMSLWNYCVTACGGNEEVSSP